METCAIPIDTIDLTISHEKSLQRVFSRTCRQLCGKYRMLSLTIIDLVLRVDNNLVLPISATCRKLHYLSRPLRFTLYLKYEESHSRRNFNTEFIIRTRNGRDLGKITHATSSDRLYIHRCKGSSYGIVCVVNYREIDKGDLRILRTCRHPRPNVITYHASIPANRDPRKISLDDTVGLGIFFSLGF
ncbi:hypothetical protein D5b_00261 [Faustovirus]|nr:hypothetical protein D5b_00261 [Faustovirus]AMN84653.1 hypothetical protein D6_00250 [Faustovirus]AMP44213.1 hypothetical protein PRJ_Dakar_00257 [Faustovirus]